MYEILLQWGLDTLAKVTNAGLQQDDSVLLEAIKTKNALVVERFKIAVSATNQIIELTIKLDERLDKYITEHNEMYKKWDINSYLNNFKREFHPHYFREYRKLRTQYGITNDLLCGYSMLLVDWIHFDNFERIVTSRHCKSFSDACRIYRIMWDYATSILTSLIRISANDLRFWLTDTPYLVKVTEWGKRDIDKAIDFMTRFDASEKFFFLTLEQDEDVKSFWKTIID